MTGNPSRYKAKMRYISRIDSNYTHCWWVRIGFNIKEKAHKSFPDSRYGGKDEAYQAAVKWRNKQLKILKPKMAQAYNYDVNGQRHWGTGVQEVWDRRGDWEYLHIRASYYDSKNKRQLKKCFSANKYGYDKAIKLAKQWRNFKLTGVL